MEKRCTNPSPPQKHYGVPKGINEGANINPPPPQNVKPPPPPPPPPLPNK